jgi:hypothetical protein
MDEPYKKLNIDKWQLVRYDIPKDGSCLFHAISLAFFKPYINELFNDRSITREQIVYNLRKELSNKLSQPINGKNGKTYYDTLNNGNTLNFSLSVPEYKLKHMQAELNSRNSIGYGYMEYICNQLNKDIYIINGELEKKDLYQSDELKLCIKGRNSIVLYYKNNHYELIGLKNEKDEIITHFKSDHAFIKYLKTLIK